MCNTPYVGTNWRNKMRIQKTEMFDADGDVTTYIDIAYTEDADESGFALDEHLKSGGTGNITFGTFEELKT